jgi:hypothetical protein
MIKKITHFIVFAQVPEFSDPSGQEPAKIKDLEVIFGRVVEVAAQFAGLGLFIMLVVGGFKLLSSRGDQQKAGEAKATITWAVIGLTVIVAGWLILKILGSVLGINLLEFTIPTE